MRIAYVLDDTCLLGLYTSIDTAARLRQACKLFSANAVLLARRPHVQLRAATGDPAVRAPGRHAAAFPTKVDDDGTWKVQQRTTFKLSIALVADLAFVGEDAHGSIVFISREQVCTHGLATPTRSIQVRAQLVTGDRVAAPDRNDGCPPDGGLLLIEHKRAKKTALEDPPEALPLKCSVSTLSGKVCVLDRMREDLAAEESRLADIARHAMHERSLACLARIAVLKEAIAIDQTRVGKSGWHGKPSAHFRLRLSMAIVEPSATVVLATTVDTPPFFVAARVETPKMKATRERRDAHFKEQRADLRENALESFNRDVFGRWTSYGRHGAGGAAEGPAAEDVAEAAAPEGPAAEEATPARAVEGEDHRSESEKRADAAHRRLSAAASERV